MVIALSFIPQYASKNISGRVDINRIKERHGSSRVDIWIDYLKKFPDYALTGVGMRRSMEVTKDTWTVQWNVTHNDYLGVLVEHGLLGLVLFIMALLAMWKQVVACYKTQSRERTFSDATILGLFSTYLVICFFLDTFSTRDTWIIFGVVAAYGSFGSKKFFPKKGKS